jgi:solute carrier family 25 thiamine pyrophosphate transporter 19
MVPYSALAFGFYEFLTQTCYRANLNTFVSSGDVQLYLGFYSKCLCSATSGVLAKTMTYPLDTVRKRLQVQGFELGRLGMGETPKYSGMRDCFAKIFQCEGYRGFFKGLVPGNLKAALSTLLYFQMYELFKEQIALLRQQQDQQRNRI